MNQLTHIDEFRDVLSDYHLSAAAKRTLDETRLVLLVGPTSSGRNTIINELSGTGQYHYVVSDTTRHPRVKDGVVIEKNGREYWFRSEDEMLAEVRRGEFVEVALIHNQQVSGISIREIEKAHHSNRIAITDVDVAGAATINKLKPDTRILFVIPPNFDVWLSRMRGRSNLPDDEIRRRMQSACKEFEAVLAHDYYTVVVNDTLEHAVDTVHHLSTMPAYPPQNQDHPPRHVVGELLASAHAFLAATAGE